MLHEDPAMLDIDVDHWRNLQSLVLDSAKARRRIVVIHEDARDPQVRPLRPGAGRQDGRAGRGPARGRGAACTATTPRRGLRRGLRTARVRRVLRSLPGHLAGRRRPRRLRPPDLRAHGRVPRRDRHVPRSRTERARTAMAARRDVRAGDPGSRAVRAAGVDGGVRGLRGRCAVDDAGPRVRRRPARRRGHDRRPVVARASARTRGDRRGGRRLDRRALPAVLSRRSSRAAPAPARSSTPRTSSPRCSNCASRAT